MVAIRIKHEIQALMLCLLLEEKKNKNFDKLFMNTMYTCINILFDNKLPRTTKLILIIILFNKKFRNNFPYYKSHFYISLIYECWYFPFFNFRIYIAVDMRTAKFWKDINCLIVSFTQHQLNSKKNKAQIDFVDNFVDKIKKERNYNLGSPQAHWKENLALPQ